MNGVEDITGIVREHERIEEPCGPTMGNGEPDHWIERCTAHDESGEIHAFDHSDHISSMVADALEAGRRALVEHVQVEEVDKDVQGYHDRIVGEITYVFENLGAATYR